MGHKVSPLAFRIGYIKTWKTSGFFDKKEYGSNVSTDLNIRFFVQSFLKGLPIANIFISHTSTGISIVIYTSRTALVLGEGDENAAKLQLAIQKKFGKLCTIEAREVKKPELSADLVADSIARQIKRKCHIDELLKTRLLDLLRKVHSESKLFFLVASTVRKSLVVKPIKKETSQHKPSELILTMLQNVQKQ